MTIIAHNYEGNPIDQLSEEMIIAGKTIPKGYCNGTTMCKAVGKRFAKYMEFSKTEPFLNALEKVSPSKGLTHTIVIDSGSNDTRGTWVSFEVAINLAQWLSPEFAAWASITLAKVINNDFEALTEDAKKAQEEIQKIFTQLRCATKESFWFIADAVKEYYDLNPRIEKYPGQNYSEVFDKLNLGLFSKKAKQIKSELGITSGLNRDHFGTESLKRIDMIQRIAEPQIKSDKNPVDSVSFALSVMMYEVMDYRE